MGISKTYLITFSPTGTSRKIGEAIAKAISPQYETIDLTRPATIVKTIPADSIVVFSAPVYGGHVAKTAAKRFKKITSNGANAVAVVVYGNRDYEKSLEEAGHLLRGNGFKVTAGATFIGEHSYSTPATPIATGRPDAADLEEAEKFGAAVKHKIENGAEEVDLSKIERTANSISTNLKFLVGAIKAVATKKKVQSPSVNTTKCLHCGQCVAECPTGAIANGWEETTDAEKCIRCCACVKTCSQGARTFDSPFAALLSKNFPEHKPNHVIL